ncbi:hypothetical protein HpVH77_05380 [Helicobacter pylori]
MFKDFYSLLKPLLLLLGLLLPFSLCIADGYISISDDWDERARNQWDEIARNHKTYYFENGLDHFNQGQYKHKPLKILNWHKNTASGLAAFI